MRSILALLKERLVEVQEELQTLQRDIARLQRVEEALALLVAEEERHSIAAQLPLLSQSTNGQRTVFKRPYSRFLLKALGDGKALSLTELAQSATQYGLDFRGKNPKKALNFTLVGMKQTGYTRMVARSVWQLTEKALQRARNQEKEKG